MDTEETLEKLFADAVRRIGVRRKRNRLMAMDASPEFKELIEKHSLLEVFIYLDKRFALHRSKDHWGFYASTVLKRNEIRVILRSRFFSGGFKYCDELDIVFKTDTDGNPESFRPMVLNRILG